MPNAVSAIVGSLLFQTALLATAGAEGLDVARFKIPAGLAKSIKEFCANAAPRKADFIEYVDGYATDCKGSIQYCVRPLFEGYSFVEINIGDNRSRGIRGLPPGYYRAEVVDATDDNCRIFDAATLGVSLSAEFRGLRQQNKCINLARIESLRSVYKLKTAVLVMPSESISEYPAESSAEAEQLFRLADNAVVAQQVSAYLSVSDRALIACRNSSSSDVLIASAIPPRAYAPRP